MPGSYVRDYSDRVVEALRVRLRSHDATVLDELNRLAQAVDLAAFARLMGAIRQRIAADSDAALAARARAPDLKGFEADYPQLTRAFRERAAMTVNRAFAKAISSLDQAGQPKSELVRHLRDEIRSIPLRRFLAGKILHELLRLERHTMRVWNWARPPCSERPVRPSRAKPSSQDRGQERGRRRR